MMTRRWRSPSEYRRHREAAIRGEDDMWKNLVALYGRHDPDPGAATAEDKARSWGVSQLTASAGKIVR
jgi:hypothetical protein